MALSALRARRAAREAAAKAEAERLEEENRLDQERLEHGKRENYRKNLLKFEKNLSRDEEEKAKPPDQHDEEEKDDVPDQDSEEASFVSYGYDTIDHETSPLSMDDDSGIDCTSVKEGSSSDDNDEESRSPYTPIKVYVGSEGGREDFTLPKENLTSHSSYFNEIFAYGIDDDRNYKQTVILPDVPIEAFTIFANFLRFGKILSSQPSDFTLRSTSKDTYHFDAEWPRLAAAWHLGDRLRSITFQDAVVDALALKVNREQSWPIDLYKSFYTSEMPRTCGIKRLLVDLALCLWDEQTLELEELEEGGERFCEFFEDLAQKREEMEMRAELGFGVEMECLDLGCEYHEHGGWEVCYREMLPDLWVTGNGLIPEAEKVEPKEGEDDELDGMEGEEIDEEAREKDTDEEMKQDDSDEEAKSGGTGKYL